MLMKTRLIDNFDEFLKLKQAWNELSVQTETDHAFMRHEWFECWINNIGRHDNLNILTGWRDGQLAAIAPMQIEKQKIKGIPAKVLSFLSSSISPRCNFIVSPDVNPEEFFNSLFQTKNCDLIITKGMEADAKITKAYLEYLQNNFPGKYVIEEGRKSPYLLTDKSWEEYRKTLHKQFRTNLNTGLNKLKNEPSFEVKKITDYDGFIGIFEGLIKTSAKSWKGKEGTDLKTSKEQTSLYREFSQKGVTANLWELWVLKINNRVAAFEYYLKCNKQLSAIRTDFDIDFRKISPGNSLKIFVIKDLMNREGVWEYDLGGMAYDYKLKWTNTIREHIAVMAGCGSFRGNLLMYAKTKIWPHFQKLKHRNG